MIGQTGWSNGQSGSQSNGQLVVGQNVRKNNVIEEMLVSKKKIELYNKVNQVCSSCLVPPEIKKAENSVEEKVGQKRGNKEELSRRMVSSDGTNEENESEKLI
ncbi:hypothetical protein C1646_771395 [Rhizophagus diaphanus]|nr:hypothetical protein C1646_771395 [Rhizophagus diaphanus] [Rhizophagus sp. MUCL 43196]